MAKIQDKLFNRVIEGDLLELSEADKERAGLGGIKAYKHLITSTAITGSVELVTTSDEKFTSVLDIDKCINITSLKNGIFLHGRFNGPTSFLSIVGFNLGQLIGVTGGNSLSSISIASANTLTDAVTEVA